MPRVRPGLSFVAFTLANLAFAGPVDDEVRQFQTYFKCPGLAIAVVQNGHVVFAKGYGSANLEDNTAVKPGTVFRIGSVSKQFLTAGIMLLEQEGKLSVDDKLSKFLEGTPAEWSNITLLNLLNHTSGMTRECPAFQSFEDVPLLDQIKSTFPLKLEFPTGSKYQYSNAGYFILAYIIEKVSGKPWGDYISDHIFKPLGMSQSGLCDEQQIIPQRARGYEYDGATLTNAIPFLTIRPSGAFISSVLDMAKWDSALWGDKVLSTASKQKMWTPAALTGGSSSPHGFGWSVHNVNGHRLVDHNGAQPGFRSSFARYLDDKLTVIVLANETATSPEMLSPLIARHFVSGLTSPYQTNPNPEQDKLELVKRYLQSRLGESPDLSLMTESLAQQVDWPAGRERFKRIGELLSLTSLKPGNLQGSFTHRYLAKFKNAKFMISVEFKGDKLEDVAMALE